MSELSQQRTSLLSTQQRLDLDQLFKTKMKLIDDASSPILASETTLSSSNGTLNSSSLSSASSGQINNDEFSDSNAESDSNVAPTVRQVLAGLNETARDFMNEYPVEKGLHRFSREIQEKLNDYYSDLERELSSSLRRRYHKYSHLTAGNSVDFSAFFLFLDFYSLVNNDIYSVGKH